MLWEVKMATNLAIDNSLIETAKQVGKHKTKKEAVTEALKEYIQRHQQANIVQLFGQIEYDKNYNYKKQRIVK